MSGALARMSDMLGTTGVVGIGLAVFSAAVYFGSAKPAEQRLEQLRLEKARLERASERRAQDGAQAAPASLEQRLHAFYKMLAAEESTGELLQSIDALGRKHGLVLRLGNYRFSREAGARFGRYELTYTAQAPYFQARLFMRDVLRELPMVSLDDVSIQRAQTTAGTTEITVRFSMLVRAEP
jgi:hypothetical protein